MVIKMLKFSLLFSVLTTSFSPVIALDMKKSIDDFKTWSGQKKDQAIRQLKCAFGKVSCSDKEKRNAQLWIGGLAVGTIMALAAMAKVVVNLNDIRKVQAMNNEKLNVPENKLANESETTTLRVRVNYRIPGSYDMSQVANITIPSKEWENLKKDKNSLTKDFSLIQELQKVAKKIDSENTIRYYQISDAKNNIEYNSQDDAYMINNVLPSSGQK